MKKIFLLVIFFSLCHCLFAQTKSNEVAVIKTNIVCDHCLQCETCGKALNANLLDLKGVKKVRINPEQNTITITYNDAKTSLDKIKKVISESGYDADEVKASPKSYNELEECCKPAAK